MRIPWAVSRRSGRCLVHALLPAGRPWPAVIGGPLLRDGLEIAARADDRRQLDRHARAAWRAGADAMFLVADVRAAKDEPHGFAEHSFIPYLSISYALTKDGAPTFKKAGLLYPVGRQDRPALCRRRRAGGAGHLSSDLYHLAAQHPRHDAPDRQGRRRARLVEAHHRQLDLHLSLTSK